MGLGAAVAILLNVARRPRDRLQAMPLQEERVRLRQAVGARDEDEHALPEILVLVVGSEAGAEVARLADIDAGLRRILGLADQEIQRHLPALLHGEELPQQAPRHLQHLHDARGDFRDADAMRIAAGQENLDGLRGGLHSGICEPDSGAYIVHQSDNGAARITLSTSIGSRVRRRAGQVSARSAFARPCF